MCLLCYIVYCSGYSRCELLKPQHFIRSQNLVQLLRPLNPLSLSISFSVCFSIDLFAALHFISILFSDPSLCVLYVRTHTRIYRSSCFEFIFTAGNNSTIHHIIIVGAKTQMRKILYGCAVNYGPRMQ